ncbi:serine hydrolase domain-containing protein [Zhihengliuella halotolerans]|uniref:CubicO group peptidase (Beta-lactamase class C family) n=1 Tax=Zhihengliuella halotolerans TaxID=370736 RepID=A0A4Q8AB77_9MICC|nr:serine hydrolase domain-containing protein [Zhihengliuella halotolerans]RZU61274.1 CubicO group peptidase (beta-lactamase class C family) [Zhihengliuella halotolerans]
MTHSPVSSALAAIGDWPVDHAAAVVVGHDGATYGTAGDQRARFRLASVTKPLAAYAVLVALEEGALELETPTGPDGATVHDLLAHTAGYDFGERTVRAAPRTRRIYSNAGFEVLGETLEEATKIPFGEYLDEAVLAPLGMTDTTLNGTPAAGAVSTAADLARFAAELMSPTLLAPESLQAASTVQFPGLPGVLPGFGRQSDNAWGLGFEIKAGKNPHWTGSANSARTFGHFGQAGTFLWVDPELRAACVALADRDFGPWAIEAWPPLSDAVVRALTAAR